MTSTPAPRETFANGGRTGYCRPTTIPRSSPTRSASRYPGGRTKYGNGAVSSRLADWKTTAAKVVFRHEQTLSKPKSDRLNLLKATRAHFGQIFMLYSDPAQSIEKILFQNFQPQVEVTDEYGVLHRVSRITDPHALRLVIGSMSDKKLIIADGHHRYETALNYGKEHAPAQMQHTRERDLASTLPHPPYPEAAAMMTFVNMDSEGLVILPTHRVVFDLKDFHPEVFLEHAAPFFEVEKLSATEAPQFTAKLAETGTTPPYSWPFSPMAPIC